MIAKSRNGKGRSPGTGRREQLNGAIKRDRSNFPESRPGDGHGETSSNWNCPIDLPPGSHLPLFARESAVLKLKESALPEEQETAIRHGNAQCLLTKDGAAPEP